MLHRGFVTSLAFVAALALACGEQKSDTPPAEPAAAAPAAPAAPPAAPNVAPTVMSEGEVVDDARLRGADSDLGNWITTGRTYSEQRYSPLDQVNDQNVERLNLTWTFETGLTRGHEATPIVLDGVMYITGSWSVVFAIDARTGKELWKYDPKVAPITAKKACCDVVNRGVAVYKEKIYSGVLDGRLIALDKKTGKLAWEVVTVDQSKPYTITGAPRIVDGKVIIGNGGAELGVRGYVSAYDAETGKEIWRTYTVPAAPSQKQESKALEEALKTWTGDEWWKVGGGGTAWDSMAFDPELRLLYIGTGNGSPWVRQIRSPDGGDNLYLSSILALNPDNGELVWHYQTTPGDNWDFTATQHMILADLVIDGQPRKVIMQAPKNGFFYVLDRQTGKLISAENYVEVTWASHVDKETGRPVEIVGQDYKDGLAFVKPTAFGGHNWHPMSFSPKTGLVYIPAQEILGAYVKEPGFKYQPGVWNTGTEFNVYGMVTRDAVQGHLLAWDPVKQKEVWRHPYNNPWNGGVLSTGGNLVFQGTADGRLVAYNASTGEELWSEQAGTGVIAAPVSYLLDGKQYVSVVAGWGGAFGLVSGEPGQSGGGDGKGKLLTFALSAEGLPEKQAVMELIYAPGDVKDGERLYHKYCVMCHGGSVIAMKGMPDLRNTTAEKMGAFDAIVRGGALAGNGMPGFGEYLSEADVTKIKGYVETRQKETAGE